MRKIFYYSLLIFIFSVLIGIYYSNQWKKNRMASSDESILNEIIKETNYDEEKIGINTKFAIKKYYNQCGHFEINYSELPQEMINMSREEIENKYLGWNIEEFNKDTLILSQNVDELCNDHYVIKLNDDFVNIYKQKKYGNMDFYKNTDISINFLTDEDIKSLEEGIYVYGKNKLNSVIEDFE